MTQRVNAFDQPIGAAVPDWTPRPRPQRVTLAGRLCRLEPLDVERHAADLHAAYADAADGRAWTYMASEPFGDAAAYRRHAQAMAASEDPLHFAVVDGASGRAVGTLALMRIDAANGVVEVGHVMFSPHLQRTPLSTEAQYLLMRHVFDDLGYRRYEWKCDSLNAPSRRTAQRLGFTFEGVFRQAIVTKGRNRDTAWFAVIDGDWPAVRAAFQAWLAPDNFDADGHQRRGLAALREAHSGDARADVQLRPLAAADHAAWLPLWRGYQSFYQVALGEALDARTWQRLLDPAEPMHAIGAFDAAGRLLGIVHCILHRSTWTEGPYCYLQDLFTVPAARGRGVGRALIEAVYAHAAAQGASRVWWLTHESNAPGRLLYDRVAQNAGFIQYRKSL
ncbi:MAG: GNAT family N-acetyltransferase [Pseudorhodoferax sp.]